MKKIVKNSSPKSLEDVGRGLEQLNLALDRAIPDDNEFMFREIHLKDPDRLVKQYKRRDESEWKQAYSYNLA